jgi:acyl-homoserine lactone acylase PvdQ
MEPALYYLQNPPTVDSARTRSALAARAVEQYLQESGKPAAGEEALNTRGERIFQVLTQDKKLTLDEMKELGLDTYVVAADVIVPLLDRAHKRDPERRLARAMDLIRAWDGRSAIDSVAFTYIYFWAKAYIDLVTGNRFSRFISHSRRKVDVDSAEEQDMALRALREAVDRIEKRFGRSEVRWGEVNVVVRGGVFPMDGTDLLGVLHPDEGVEQEDGRIHSNDGWGHLMVVMEGEPKQIWSLLPYGQSEDPGSPHYNDQAKLHSRRALKRFWFTPNEILQHAASVWGTRDRLEKLR